MKRLLQFALTICYMTVGTQIAWAQGSGSVEATGGSIGNSAYSSAAGDTTASLAETLFMGPGTYQIDGVWQIYSKYIWVSPDAVITGDGTIQFFNPEDASGAASTTYMDGNNILFDVNVELHNAQNMVLADMADPGYGNDNIGNASFYEGRIFGLSVDNGDVILGQVFEDLTSQNTPVSNTSSTVTDFILNNNATLSNYDVNRMVVTSNSTQGHLVKENYTGSFIYPVGIAEGDYTPAAVNNSTSNTIHVSVQDYAASAPEEIGASGVDRTWNIYGDNSVAGTSIDLQHNTATTQASYNDISGFVTQYSSTTPNTTGETPSHSAWQSNNPSAGSGSGTLTTGAAIEDASELSLEYSTLATSASEATSFFSKSSNQLYPLPVKLIRFDGRINACSVLLNWETAEESGIDHFDLQKSINGSTFQSIASIMPKGNNSNYTYTDEQSTARASYRLRMADIDGKEGYSKIIPLSVHCGEPVVIKAYPNPTDNLLTVSGITAKDRLQLTNGAGQVVANIIASGNVQEIDMHRFKSGIYLLQIMQDNKIIKNIKLIKK